MKDLLNEKHQLNEKKKLDQKYLDKLHLLTQNNNHTEARIYLSMMLQVTKGDL